mgnify:CR=1 FL=1
MPDYDAVIVGSGPNGLSAAITLAQDGWKVLLLEAKATIGGGARTQELTLPGFRHDVCSAIHPLGIGSPFFRALSLEQVGLEWIQPDTPLAHPFDDGSAARMERSIAETGVTLGEDADAYQRLMQPFVERWQELLDDILGPFPFPPRHPVLLARFGLQALRSARSLAQRRFKGRNARALFAGQAAHSFLPLEHIASASFGIVLGLLGHAVGWAIPRGGSQSIVDALAAHLRTLGGEIVVNHEVNSVDDLPSSRAVLFDVTPRQLLRLAGHRFPPGYRAQLERYRYGPGVFKVDWALDAPIPWTAPACHRAGTVHLGATLDEIALSERQSFRGQIPDVPFVLVAQQSLFDPTRAPEDKQTGWAYCHVPHGSTVDMTAKIEQQVERFAPGFRERILARHTINPAEYEQHNPNFIGGDINGGVQDIWQLFTRPSRSLRPYRTPTKGIYIGSASTPPGGGVHGMGGFFAARAAMKDSL